MNKRGLVFFYTLMLGITVIVLGMAFAKPIQSVIDERMTDLTCTAPADDVTQATCWGLDILKPVLVGGTIAIGLAIIGATSWRET